MNLPYLDKNFKTFKVVMTHHEVMGWVGKCEHCGLHLSAHHKTFAKARKAAITEYMHTDAHCLYLRENQNDSK